MMNIHVGADVRGWAVSRDREALAQYVRWEYGPRAGVGFLYAAAAAPGRGRGGSRRADTLGRAVARTLRDLRLWLARSVRNRNDRPARTDG